MRAALIASMCLVLPACAAKPAHDPDPGEYGTPRHFLFGFALATGIPRDKAGCVIDEVMERMSTTEVSRIEAIARTGRHLEPEDMATFDRIRSIAESPRQPSVEAIIASECDL